MRVAVRVALAAFALASLVSAAEAKVRITVDLDRQTMHVVSKDRVFDWKVSTGRSGYETPNGTYGVLWMDRDHHSDEYDNAPMPNAIFFSPGYAIHGSYRSAFGHPASHGCIRLPVAKSVILFALVKAEGADVKIVGDSPTTVASRRSRVHDDDAAGSDDGSDPYYARDGRRPVALDAHGYARDDRDLPPVQYQPDPPTTLFGSIF